MMVTMISSFSVLSYTCDLWRYERGLTASVIDFYWGAFENFSMLCVGGSHKSYGGLDHYLRSLFPADMGIQSRVAMVLLKSTYKHKEVSV